MCCQVCDAASSYDKLQKCSYAWLSNSMGFTEFSYISSLFHFQCKAYIPWINIVYVLRLLTHVPLITALWDTSKKLQWALTAISSGFIHFRYVFWIENKDMLKKRTFKITWIINNTYTFAHIETLRHKHYMSYVAPCHRSRYLKHRVHTSIISHHWKVRGCYCGPE